MASLITEPYTTRHRRLTATPVCKSINDQQTYLQNYPKEWAVITTPRLEGHAFCAHLDARGPMKGVRQVHETVKRPSRLLPVQILKGIR